MSAHQFEQIQSAQNSFATRLTDWRMQHRDLMITDDDFCRERQQVVDGQIAAIAIANGLILVTRNSKDFEGISSLQLENWFV